MITARKSGGLLRRLRNSRIMPFLCIAVFCLLAAKATPAFACGAAPPPKTEHSAAAPNCHDDAKEEASLEKKQTARGCSDDCCLCCVLFLASLAQSQKSSPEDFVLATVINPFLWITYEDEKPPKLS